MLFAPSVFRRLRLLWYLELFPIVFMVVNALRCGKGAEALNSLVPVMLLMLAIYSLGFVIFCAVWSRPFDRIAAVVLLALCAVLNTVDLFTYLNFGDQFRFAFLYAMATTNAGELSGFFRLHLMRPAILVLVCYGLGIVPVAMTRGKASIAALALCGAMLPAVLAPAFRPVPPIDADGYPVRLLPDLVDRIVDDLLEMRFNAEDIEVANRNIDAENHDRQATYVLVLGESHAKARSQLYGAARATEPRLEARRKAGELAVFTDAVAPHSMTVYALAKVLTLEAHDSDYTYYDSPNLCDVMKAAGFRTWWIDNQGQMNALGLSYNAIARRADCTIYTAASWRTQPDGVLLKPFAAALADPAPKKFIVVHLLGSHSDYTRAAPEDFPGFAADDTPGALTPEQEEHRAVVDAYDKTILYNDLILDQMMSMLDERGGKAFLLYLSDHGENLYEERQLTLHSESMPTRATVEVPVLLYLTPAYRKAVGEAETARIFAAASRPIATENTFSACLHLAGVTLRGADPARDWFSDDFTPRPRLTSLVGLDYETLKNTSYEERPDASRTAAPKP